mmetsp:Transcript_125617/g.351785  ORF Transcript_125617/g.351785 Transcript_125617/m.351785 type:complete len:460 (-) Transcript_125617:71-1450(-)
MASLTTCLVTGTVWCFCTAAGSLLASCCGNDKPSSVAPGASSGRKRSVLLLILAIGIAFCFQYWVGPTIVNFNAPVDNILSDAWLSGCTDLETQELIERCAGNAGVYRSSFSALVFFLLAGIAAACKRTANREAWPAKYVLFLFLVAGMCFVPNDPLFLTVQMNIARVGGVIFILFQQIVFVDIAMNWNDSWVEKSNAAEEEETGSGQKWLYAILVSAVSLFLVSFIGWVLLFVYFGNCPTNTAFITVTVLFSIMITMAQLSGEEGSLLSSATISAYATMLCYSAVTKNDDEQCNPFLGEDDVLGIIIGVGLTVVTLGYAGWSATADEKLSARRESSEDQPSSSPLAPTTPEASRVTGIVTNDYGTGEVPEEEGGQEGHKDVPTNFSNSWKLNFVLASVSCWFAMSLTGWGSIQTGGNVADPLVGQASMWMIVGSQWFVLTLYLWTLVAPRLFPDRDFS